MLSRHAVGAKVEIRRLSYFFFLKLLTYAKINVIPQKTKHVGTLWKLRIVAETLCGIFLHSEMLQAYDICFDIVVRRLTTGIVSEKCVVMRFRRCANVIECTYINLDSIV